MAASSAVGNSGEVNTGKLGQARSAPHRVRASLTRQESALLSGGFAIALLSFAISIIARTSPGEAATLPALGLGLVIFALGSMAGVASALSLGIAPKIRAAKPTDSLHLKAAMDISPNGFAVWDRHGHLIRANSNYTEFLDLATADLLLGAPREMIRTIHGKSITRILDKKSNLIESKRGSFVVNRQQMRNGDTIELLTDISILKDREQALGEQESQLRATFKEMNTLREESTAQAKSMEQLRIDLGEEQKISADAIRTKSEFLSHMSHELRTPLNAILGFSDMMRGEIFGPMGHPKYDEYAHDIHSSGQNLLSLIADILDVSQIQTGDVPIDRQRIDLEKTIVDCLNMIRPRIYETGISLIEKVDRPPTVQADPMAVRQILMHILSNAMKFTPSGGRISIKSEIDLEFVTIIIDDTGTGIAPEIMARLDEPFSMIDQDAHISGEEGSGLGVGLAVSQSLARLNGGDLIIQSELGYGTTVRIKLPRR